MAGQQIQDLLIEVSRKLAGVERLLERLDEDGSSRAEELSGIRERLAALEATVEQAQQWNGEERRKVDGRLETGDHTFEAIRAEIKNVERLAKWCQQKINAKVEPETKKRRPWWAEKLLEALIPMVVGFIWWALYHLLLVGPKIAEAMKTVNPSGGHHP